MSELEKKLIAGICSRSAAETEELAARIGAILPVDTVLALHGNLGAGKTTFVRGLARAWGIQESITSPTFNLYTIYKGDRQLIHLDAYRLDSGADLDALMIEDFLQPPWCFAVEWPERIPDALPQDAWRLFLTINEDQSHQIRLESL
ncbi:MAG: tRNA (adenosine(37)-N6)-threonylcarbamoyltransferase complex ATPase subunit type 1 TsaE [Puniceicoccaceae bacterium]|nr:tRNA (adenosine(37)-N6)-threonylcarbamoyltransferase complex ATPase subunit type 1 TsaE [Puniceicoccaceae bacterium]